MKVPDDVSLIGFDHIQSRLPIPFELTSVSSYKGRMSLEAVDILVRKIHNQESFKKLIELLIQNYLTELLLKTSIYYKNDDK